MANKQTRKLLKLNVKAQNCLSREKAQKIIKKAAKAHQKVFAANFWAPVKERGHAVTPLGVLIRLFNP